MARGVDHLVWVAQVYSSGSGQEKNPSVLVVDVGYQRVSPDLCSGLCLASKFTQVDVSSSLIVNSQIKLEWRLPWPLWKKALGQTPPPLKTVVTY